ncbi:MAG TPA: glyoxalase superfamily protein [Vicinamibacterales bacterium]|nr:glyoxalase superfamily protein [Vicinamibacterales bacterium]
MSAKVEVGSVTPILRVADIAASVDYYTRVLGFALNWRDDDGNAFASVTRGGCTLFLSVGDQGHAGGWVWVATADADALGEELRANGAKVRHPPANYPWGSREVHIEDLDGNVIRFGSANKAGEPSGDWLDMHGVRWTRTAGGGWTRA